MKPKIRLVDVTPSNVSEVGIYCSKDKKSSGFIRKVEWFQNKLNDGLQIKIAMDENDKQLGFIEFIPSELAWRPINAKKYMFVQCIVLFSKKDRNKELGSTLLNACEEEARKNDKNGVCAMTSKGPWIANKTLFEKNNYSIVAAKGRFELMCKKFKSEATNPVFINWTLNQAKYKGWNLVYSDQCPWHDKSVIELQQTAKEYGVNLKVSKLISPKEAQEAPSGYGTYSLLKDGVLLEDHYLSKTRFRTILEKELKK